MAARILVVDDEPKIRDAVRLYLERDHHLVSLAADGREALQAFHEEQPALVILDLMLPVVDGWQVCREIRRVSSVPVIMLTARDGEPDTLLGLDLGADDYVTKPFSPRELAARVRAVLRRTGVPATGSERVQAGPLLIDEARHEARCGDAVLALTPSEFRLLLALARASGRVLTRSQLAERALGDDFEGYDRTIDAHIKNLRHKLRDAGVERCVETVRGVGYRLAEPSDAAA